MRYLYRFKYRFMRYLYRFMRYLYALSVSFHHFNMLVVSLEMLITILLIVFILANISSGSSTYRLNWLSSVFKSHLAWNKIRQNCIMTAIIADGCL